MAVVLLTLSAITLIVFLVVGTAEGWEDAPPFVKPMMLTAAAVIVWVLTAYHTARFEDVTLCTSRVTNVVLEPPPGRTVPDEMQIVYDRDSHEVVSVNRLFGRILAKGTVMEKKQKAGGWNLGVYFNDDTPRWMIPEAEDSKGGQK